MPRMTNRWRNAGYALAVFGIIAAVLNALSPYSGYSNPQLSTTVLLALFNGLVWFGIVYLVFLATVGLRRLLGGASKQR